VSEPTSAVCPVCKAIVRVTRADVFFRHYPPGPSRAWPGGVKRLCEGGRKVAKTLARYGPTIVRPGGMYE
jgi:hypothetical protein